MWAADWLPSFLGRCTAQNSQRVLIVTFKTAAGYDPPGWVLYVQLEWLPCCKQTAKIGLCGGCGQAVKAPGCGPGDREFKSPHPPHMI